MARDAARTAADRTPLALLSLSVRLVLAFALVSVVGIGLAAVLAHRVTVRQFEQFFLDKNRAEFVTGAAAYYVANDSWAGVDEELRRQAPRAPGKQVAPPIFALADADGVVVSPADPYRPGERIAPEAAARAAPVIADGRTIGWVLDAARKPQLSDREEAYLASTNRALSLAALGAVTVALVLGALLARSLTRPLRELTHAVQAMARGDLLQEVPVRSRDEIGTLTRAFNQMSADLARANALRRQMTADIAHDLRTPLTVILGYLEALRDGMFPATPERFEAMYAEARHLTRLVEDLRTLSLADAEELPICRQAVEPRVLLDRVAAAFGPLAAERDVGLTTAAEADLPAIDVDLERIVQVLANLVSNAIRHTPPGGRIEIAASRRGDAVVLTVQDDGEGIPPAVLPHVFDRLYRGDSARTRETGESGLGLAIARSLARAHGGDVIAESEGEGRGSVFTVRLPCRASAPRRADDGSP